MKAVIEESNGLYIVRIYENNGFLYDVHVVDEIELKTYERDGDFKCDQVEWSL